MGRRRLFFQNREHALKETESLKAHKLYIDGHSFREIARRLNKSVGYCHELVRDARREVQAMVRETAAEKLDIEVERLNNALVVVSEILENEKSTPEQKISAAKEVRANTESRAKLLGIHPDQALMAEQLIQSREWFTLRQHIFGVLAKPEHSAARKEIEAAINMAVNILKVQDAPVSIGGNKLLPKEVEDD
jgi:hypothetical protein